RRPRVRPDARPPVGRSLERRPRSAGEFLSDQRRRRREPPALARDRRRRRTGPRLERGAEAGRRSAARGLLMAVAAEWAGSGVPASAETDGGVLAPRRRAALPLS